MKALYSPRQAVFFALSAEDFEREKRQEHHNGVCLFYPNNTIRKIIEFGVEDESRRDAVVVDRHN